MWEKSHTNARLKEAENQVFCGFQLSTAETFHYGEIKKKKKKKTETKDFRELVSEILIHKLWGGEWESGL